MKSDYSAEDKLLVRCLNNIAAMHAECPEGLEEVDEFLSSALEFYTQRVKDRKEGESESNLILDKTKLAQNH